jgi:hypothetical protein
MKENKAHQLAVIAPFSRPIGRPKATHTKRFTTCFKPSVYIALNDLAVSEESSIGDVVRWAVDSYLRTRGINP